MEGFLYINKPAGMTSFDVIQALRKATGEKRIGHSGTLDPQATGVLIVALGKSTKVLPYLLKKDKTYKATMQLGIKTSTGDIWGDIKEQEPIKTYPLQQIMSVLESFLGVQTQIPPMVSAIRHQGKRLYEYARENVEIERKPRPIEIKEIKLLDYDSPDICFEVTCSAGTYIRTLCEDVAAKLDTIAAMSALIRTQSGEVSLSACDSLEDALLNKATLHSCEQVLSAYPSVKSDQVTDIKNGKSLSLSTMDELVFLRDTQGEYLAAYRRQSDGSYKCERGLW